MNWWVYIYLIAMYCLIKKLAQLKNYFVDKSILIWSFVFFILGEKREMHFRKKTYFKCVTCALLISTLQGIKSCRKIISNPIQCHICPNRLSGHHMRWNINSSKLLETAIHKDAILISVFRKIWKKTHYPFRELQILKDH